MADEKLWAPWRMEYILKQDEDGCILCDKPAEEDDRENLILFRGKSCFVIMNRYPYNNGHLMISPYSHTSDYTSLTPGERADCQEVLAECVNILGGNMHPDGYNLGLNLGRPGGAGIEEHLHWHIVPRWVGDNNFMPVIGHTKVMVEGLLETYDRLSPIFKKLVVG